ncbi:hypothetical protein DSO57_1017515 [Entomophthora muscae]|uniref:Uncharacterized protein n=1 Tax=Entomophthora muscae TaxID=34485 RepID=A0ACC2T4N1_9FUNG|nr:hypothetical protein DSO57_1017515 [Entomophthora muscae]
MSALSITQCMPTPYSHLNYARGNVSSYTTGIVDTMQLSTGVHWKTNASFTDHFLKSSKHLFIDQSDGRGNNRLAFEAFYHWEGGIPVSDPIACYEHERCTATVTWDGKRWTSKTSKVWITPTTFQTSSYETNTYIRSGNKINYTHTFDGPKIQTIYFNQLSHMLSTKYFHPMYFLRGLRISG